MLTKYSQNDLRWKNDKMGSSNFSLGGWGCTTSCCATLASFFGDTLTPKDLAKHKELYTSGGLIIWTQLNHIFEHTNFLIRVRFFNEAAIDEALRDPDKTVMINVWEGYHWVSVLKKTYLGYTCSDPYSFPARNINYKNRDISGFAILVRK